jgi:putative transposase
MSCSSRVFGGYGDHVARNRCRLAPESVIRFAGIWEYAPVSGIELDFIAPGKPIQNCYIESFNGRLRDECLNQHWFGSMKEVQMELLHWREEYNKTRPHSSVLTRK